MRFSLKKIISRLVLIGIILSVGVIAWRYAFRNRTYLTALAIKNNDYSICYKQAMTETCQGWPCAQTRLCLLDFVAVHPDPEACDSIKPVWWEDKSQCYVVALHNAEADVQYKHCDDGFGQSYNKAYCYGYFAASNKKPLDCLRLKQKILSNECVETYLRKIETPDPGACDKYVTADFRDWCKRVAAAKKVK